MNTKLWAIAVAVALAGAACGKKDVNEPGAIPSGPDAWVHYIPADSPLVVASLKPMPASMVDWLAEGFGPIAAVLQTEMGKALAESDDDRARAVLAELDGKLSRAGMAEIGVKLDGRFALYSLGLSLAVRVELADGERFRAFIERLEKAAGESLQRAELEGVTYLSAGDEDVAVVVAVPGNELIVGIMPAKARTQVLPLLLGVQRPEKSVADTGVLPKLVDKYELSGVFPGYFDSHALVRMLSGRGSAVTQATLAAVGADLAALAAPACQKELDGLADIAPRLVFDYTKMQPPQLETMAVLELRQDVARDLMGVQLPVHGLGDPTTRRMFVFGLGFDLDKLFDWMGAKAKGVVAAPYQCPELAELNEMMADLDRELASARASLPAFAAGFRGMTVVLSDLQVAGAAPSGAGYAAIGVAQPMALLDMARGYIPELGNVQVKAGGAPATVTTGMPGLDPLYLTVQGSWLGAAVGKGMADQMTAALRAAPSAKGPFLVLAYDYGRFLSMMQAAGEMSEMSPEEQTLVQALVQMFGYSVSTFRFEPHGMVATQLMQGR
jgi:hypothetical protein